MSIRRKGDGKYYAICDFDGCRHEEVLKSTDFWEAKDEAKRLGFKLYKDKEGNWVNLCTEFCRMCYFQKPIIIYQKDSE